MKQRTERIARVLVLVAVLVALVAFARTIDWIETWHAIRSASIVVLVTATLVNLLSLALKSVRWWIFLRPIGSQSLWLAIRATFAGAALNNLVVANAGEAARVIFVSRHAHVPSAAVLATLAIERLCELFGYVLMLVVAVSFLQLSPAMDHTRPYAIAALLAVSVLVVYLVRNPEKAAIPTLQGGDLLSRARNYGRQFLATLTSLSTGPRFGLSLAISVMIWSLQVVTYQLTARAADFNIPLVATVAAILAVNLGFAVRVTPGNLGVFQVIYSLTAAAFGMDKDQAIGVGLLIQAQQILPVTILGLLAAPQMLSEDRPHLPQEGVL